MLRLEEIRKDSIVRGILADQPVRVIQAEPAGDALTVYFKTDDGNLKEHMLFRTDEARLSLADTGRPWAFDASGEDFKIATEAYRINLAYLFDPMMAVHTSNVEPLPHQITAVYESMLPRQPLRYVLADDPGAGKTIMAGLFIRELMMRADGKRILIIAPGSLVEQWKDELYEKFGLSFRIFSRALEAESHVNPFDENDCMIARVDQLSRDDTLLEKLKVTQWDLVVVDEAHKMSASWQGRGEVKKTKRFQLGEMIGARARHFLLMTATPHNGKEEDFQLFMSLLDSDRFYGKFRDGAHKVDVTDLMRRMVKEELLKFDGKRLFPERFATTLNYKLSDEEAALYEAVTEYVTTQMNKADEIQGKRKGTVGFALTGLQRRLASSPEAIFQSLRRRRDKLKRRIEEEKLRHRGQTLSDVLQQEIPRDWEQDWDEAADDMSAEEFETLEDEVVDQATAARTIEELEIEVDCLEELVVKAQHVAQSRQDSKWKELSLLLQDNPEMLDASGHRRKIIIFTEHRDTLNYLNDRIVDLLGNRDAVVQIHGGIKRDERRKVQGLFRNDKDVLVLLATDAAGEGVNLQNANLMVNYDLPWNPNRIEQRFGRIHRIGQTEPCHLWNMVASETREGDVFHKLFEKLEVERKALGGRVFDILGEVFEGRSLKDMLMEAIRYGNRPDVQAKLDEEVSDVLNTDHLKRIMERNALAEEVMSPERLYAVKEQMEKAEARKLQPFFIRSFFQKAFRDLGGELRDREQGRYEITHVPAIIRERDRLLTGRDRRFNDPVHRRYERICFEKQHVHYRGKPMAELIHPAHPLMQSIIDLMLEQHRPKLKQGAILVDPSDMGTLPKLLFMVDHSVKEGDQKSETIASRRMQFVAIDEHGHVENAGWAPHLDLHQLEAADAPLIQDILNASWIQQGLEQRVLNYASSHLVPEHYQEIKQRREQMVDKTLKAVHERLVKEINYQADRVIKLREDVKAGKQPHVQAENAERVHDELQARLNARTAELNRMRQVVSATPLVAGGALVIPQGLLNQRRGEGEFSADAASRSHIERVAMQAVMQAEEALGNRVADVSADKCGWDVTSIPPKDDEGRIPTARHIEVKGRAKGQATITVTRNEVLYGLNQADKFILAVVLVDGDAVDGPHYIREPFSQEPDWATTSINLDLKQLLTRAVRPT